MATKEKKERRRAPAYKHVVQKMTVSDAISQANSERETLAEEMRSWCDNMEEKFSTTSRFETASAAADALEGIDEVDCGNLDDDSQGEEIEVGQSVAARKGRGESRATRSGNAAALFEAAASALTSRAETLREKATEREEAETKKEEKKTEDTGVVEGAEAKQPTEDEEEDDYDGPDSEELSKQADECEEVAQNCEQAKDELEGVEFPGMYG